jgi:hypothetical protein
VYCRRSEPPARRFSASAARQGQAFLIHFEREVELLEDLTSSRQKLESALDSLDRPELQRQGSGGGNAGGGYPGGGGGRRYPGGGGGGRFGGGTALYDAVFLAGDEVLRKQKGRKAVIVLSDGVDNASKTSLTGAIEAAQRSDTIVYCLFADGWGMAEGAVSTGLRTRRGRRGAVGGCLALARPDGRRSWRISEGNRRQPLRGFEETSA